MSDKKSFEEKYEVSAKMCALIGLTFQEEIFDKFSDNHDKFSVAINALLMFLTSFCAAIAKDEDGYISIMEEICSGLKERDFNDIKSDLKAAQQGCYNARREGSPEQ